MGVATAVIAYWPAIVAGLYLLYTLAAAVGGDPAATAHIVPAVAAVLTAIGVNHQVVGAGAKADAAHAALFAPPQSVLATPCRNNKAGFQPRFDEIK